MAAWWDALDSVSKILYCIAIPSTIFLVIQTVLIILGFDGGDAIDGIDGIDGIDTMIDGVDAIDGIDGIDSIDSVDLGSDIDSDFHTMSDVSAFRLFTFQGIVAFFCVFGWTSIAGISGGLNKYLAILGGLIAGFVIMFLISKLIQWSKKLTHNGAINLKNTIGESGEVYLLIPGKGKGHGKVNVVIQGKLIDFDAITEQEDEIKTGEGVRIVDIKGETLVVERE